MNLSYAYIDRVVARLVAVAEVSYRRIFNGVGIYHRGAQFALIINDKLYFRADDRSRLLYIQRGMPAFQPRAAVQVESQFFQLSNEILDQPTELRFWVRTAIDAACGGEFQDEESDLQTPVRHLRQRA